MASKLSFFIAIALYLCSLFLPAWEDAIGLQVLFMAIFGHIILIGIPFAFPAWANLFFYLAVKKYIQNEKQPSEDGFHLGLVWVFLTLIFMCFGLLIMLTKGLQIGSILWLQSGLFLLIAFGLKNLRPHLALLCLGSVVTLVGALTFKMYTHSKDLPEKLWLGQESQLLFSKLATNQSDVPDLVQVLQNHADRMKGTGKRKPPEDENAVDLSMLEGQRIEVDFDQIISPSLKESVNTSCALGVEQQHFIYYPRHFWEKGYEWQHPFYSRHLAIAIGRPQENHASILYRATRLDAQHTQIELVDKASQQVVYSQKLKTHFTLSGCRYLPDSYSSELESAFNQLFDERPAFEERYATLKAEPQYAESLDRRCQWDYVGHNEYLFEHKKIRIMTEKLVQPQFLCAKHYVAVAYMTRTGNDYTPIGEMEVTLFKRENFDSILCDHFRLDLTAEQQVQYNKGQFQLERIRTAVDTDENQCAPFQFYFSDGSVQEKSNYTKIKNLIK